MNALIITRIKVIERSLHIEVLMVLGVDLALEQAVPYVAEHPTPGFSQQLARHDVRQIHVQRPAIRRLHHHILMKDRVGVGTQSDGKVSAMRSELEGNRVLVITAGCGPPIAAVEPLLLRR
jgi:hypothetical protein